MSRCITLAVLAVGALALAPTSPALAAGTNSGGVNSGGLVSGGGGGGGTSPAVPCAQITSWGVSAGQTPGDRTSGAIWTKYTVKNCSSGMGSYMGRLTYANLTTGETQVGGCALTQTTSAPGGYYQTSPMNPGQSISCSLDNDFVALGTSFKVSLVVADNASGTSLASSASTVTTPAQANG